MAIRSISIYADNELNDYAINKYSVIPPSPEVSSLMKYVDVPVSHFTGQPQIEIPIYTLTEGSISVPISLSYKGGGVKQNELPGIISKGWTLIAGMTISRTVYGLPDECNKNSSSPTWMRGLFHLSSNDTTLRNTLINRSGEFDPSELNASRVQSYESCADYEKGYVDFANDIYKFYGQGMSGTFIFDENQQITLSTGSPIKLNSTSGWNHYDYVMTDKDLTTYTFGAGGVETTQMPINAEGYNVGVEVESNMEKLSYESAWHITQMRSVYGDIVNFEYSIPTYRNNYLGPTQYYTYYNGGTLCYLTNRTSLTAMSNKYFGRSLLAIKSKSTTVKFHYDNDLAQLEAVSIHKNDTDTTEIWRYQLVRDSNGNLSQINQVGKTNSQELYGFNYYAKSCTNKFAFDHWGYCNGASSNTTILPMVSGLEHLPYTKANREPSVSYAIEDVLCQIKYPTGGTTNITWEQNDYSYIQENGSYLQSSTKILSSDATITLRGTQIEQCLKSGDYAMAEGDYFIIDLSTYIDPLMNSGSCFQLEFSSEYENSLHSEPYPRLDVFRNGIIYKQYAIDKANSKSLKTIISDGASYRFAIANPLSFSDMSETDINNFWGEAPSTAYENYGYINIIKRNFTTEEDDVIESWGGLRVAEIQSNTSDGNSITKKYSYTKTIDDKTYSSGVIRSLPKYSYQGGAYFKDDATGYEYVNMYGVTSNGLSSTMELNIVRCGNLILMAHLVE